MDLSTFKNPGTSYVEIKRVTWSKDSHGLFDYESKNVNFSKTKVETSSDIFKEGNDIQVRPVKKEEPAMEIEDPNYLFSIVTPEEKKDKFFIKAPKVEQYESNKSNLFLIVRSLKDEDGVQRGCTLELGDIIRLGRIEYKVIEYQDNKLNRFSMFDMSETTNENPFNLVIKKCELDPDAKHQCRICLMDEHDTDEILVNPCNCKGTSQYVHIACLQNWINSKVKNKQSPESSCSYWKHLSCEVCKTPLPDLIDSNGTKIQLVPACRPNQPYMLVERIFYDKSKGGENSRMMVLLSLNNEAHQLKLGRGHECDIRENDISVSRLHAFIKYQDSKFVIIDNNSKFGTLILLRRELEIERRKIAVQLGRTVITFSLKHSTVNNVPVSKQPNLIESLGKPQQPKGMQEEFDKIQDFNFNDEEFPN